MYFNISQTKTQYYKLRCDLLEISCTECPRTNGKKFREELHCSKYEKVNLIIHDVRKHFIPENRELNFSSKMACLLLSVGIYLMNCFRSHVYNHFFLKLDFRTCP